jgi:hypothetical protein
MSVCCRCFLAAVSTWVSTGLLSCDVCGQDTPMHSPLVPLVLPPGLPEQQHYTLSSTWGHGSVVQCGEALGICRVDICTIPQQELGTGVVTA